MKIFYALFFYIITVSYFCKKVNRIPNFSARNLPFHQSLVEKVPFLRLFLFSTGFLSDSMLFYSKWLQRNVSSVVVIVLFITECFFCDTVGADKIKSINSFVAFYFYAES